MCCTAADNKIGEAGATALAAAFQKNTTITSVDLGCARAWLGGRGGLDGGIGGAWARSRARRAGALRCGERGRECLARARAPFEW